MKLSQEECMTMNKLNMEFRFSNYHMNIINCKTLEKIKVKRDVRERKREVW